MNSSVNNGRDVAKEAFDQSEWEATMEDFIALRNKNDLLHKQAIDIARNTISRRQQMRELEKAAYHDHLTGLLNRPGLTWAYESMVENSLRSARKAEQRAVLFIDVDRFKTVNDNFSHETGDQVLVAVAHKLRSRLREGDLIGRWGGDEFVVFLESASQEEAILVGEDLCSQVREINNLPTNVTVSIGVDRPHLGQVLADSVDNADQAMYAAKQAGGDQVILLSQPNPADIYLGDLYPTS